MFSVNTYYNLTQWSHAQLYNLMWWRHCREPKDNNEKLKNTILQLELVPAFIPFIVFLFSFFLTSSFPSFLSCSLSSHLLYCLCSGLFVAQGSRMNVWWFHWFGNFPNRKGRMDFIIKLSEEVDALSTQQKWKGQNLSF